MQYTSSEGGASFSGKCSAILKFSGGAVWIMAFVGCFYNIRKKWFVHTSYIVYMLLELIFLGMSGKHLDHYGMVLIPAVVYPLSLIIENVENLSDKEGARVAKMLISIYIISAIIVPSSIGTLKAIPSFYENRGNEQPDDTTRRVSDVVLNLTTEDDAISVYGNWDIIYVLTQRRHATKYSYQDPIGQVMPEIMEEYMEQLEEELPPIIVVSDEHYDDRIQSFLEKHEYSPVWPKGDEGLDYSSSVRVFFHPAETE